MMSSVEIKAVTYPYPGLRAFGADEAEIFFGREEHVDDLLYRLQKRRFLAVVGPSGCGKSSLVRAGMIPALHAGLIARAGSGWQVAVMRPGTHPLKNLAQALGQSTGAVRPVDDEDGFLPAVLGRGPLGLEDALAEYEFPCGTNLLLLVDQFEELFRFSPDGDASAARAFVDLLLAAARGTKFPVYVVLTMRSDFLGHCPVFRGLPEMLNDSQYLTPRLNRDQQRAAIEGPAALFNTTIRPEVVNRILNAMGTDPDQLPLMQHLLMRMWRTERKKLPDPEQPIELTMKSYEEVGGLHGCVSRHAERICAELTAEEARLAELLFRRLTEVTPDTRLVRRPRRYGDLCRLLAPAEDSPARAALRKVIDEFRVEGRSFLMPPQSDDLTADALIDISHESIIRQWGRLKDWVQDEHNITRVSKVVTERATRWKEQGEHEDYLLFGVDLAEAKVWREKYPAQVGEDEEKLLAESVKHEQEDVRRQEALRYTKQLEGKNYWLKVLAWVAATSAVVAILLGIRAYQNSQAAAHNFQVAADNAQAAADYEREAAKQEGRARKETAQRLALMAIEAGTYLARPAEIDEDVTGAVVWYANALASMREHEDVLPKEAFEMMTKNIRFRLGAAWRRLPKLEHLLNHAGLQTFDLRSDQLWAVTGSKENGALLWDLRDETPRPLGPRAPVNVVCFSPKGGYAVTASGNAGAKDTTGEVRFWLVPSGEDAGKRLETAHAVVRMDYSRNGERLLVVSSDREQKACAIYVWECQDGLPAGEPKKLDSGQGWVNSAELSDDGSQVVVGIEDHDGKGGRVWLWNLVADSVAEGKCEVAIASASVVAEGKGGILSYSGKEGDKSGEVVLWENREGCLQRKCTIPHGGVVRHAAVDPFGRTAITSGYDGKTRLWNLTVNTANPTLRRAPLSGGSRQESPEPLLARELRELRHGGSVSTASFSPDGQYVCTACRDSTVRVWDVASGELVVSPLYVAGATVDKVAFLDDGYTLVAWSSEGATARIWKLLADDARTLFLKTPDNVKYATYGEDAQRAVTVTTAAAGTGRCEVRVWDTTDGKPVAMISPHPAEVRFAALSRDGRRLVTIDDHNVARLWALEDNGSAKRLSPPAGLGAPAVLAAFDPNGGRVVTVTGDALSEQGDAHLWDANTGQLIRRFTGGHKTSVTFASFSPDGHRLVTTNGKHGLQTGEARLWGVDTGTLIAPLEEGTERHAEAIFHAAFSPDGRYVVTSSADNSARLWDAHTGAPVRHGGQAVKLKHTADVVQAAFSPDAGEYVVTAAMDGKAVVWDARTGERKLRLDHPAAVLSASFSRKGNHVITVSHGGAVRLWDMRVAKTQVDGVRPKPLVGVFNHPGVVFHASLRVIEENVRGNLIVLGTTHGGSAPQGESCVVLKEWTFTRDDRPVEQLLAEAQLLAHRKVDENSRSLVLIPDVTIAKNWEDGRQQYRENMRLFVRSPAKLHAYEVDKAEARGHWTVALWHLNRLISLNGEELAHLVRRAECYRQIAALASTDEVKKDNLKLALEDYSKALKYSAEPTFFAGRGRIYAELYRADEALSDYERALEIGRTHGRPLRLEKARVHEMAGGVTRTQWTTDFIRSFNVDRTRLNTPQLAKAIAEYEAILTDDERQGFPPDLNVLRVRAYLYSLNGKGSEAVADYTKVIDGFQGDPRVWDLFEERAHAHAESKQVAKAAEDYEAAAQGFAQSSRIADGVRALQSAINLKPLDPGAEARLRVSRGELYLRQYQLDAAQRDFTRALELRPGEWKAHEGVGRARTSQGQWSLAADAYENAATQAPEGVKPKLWEQAGQMHERAFDWRKAAEAYSAVLNLHEQRQPATLQSRARAYASLRLWDRAAADLGEAIAQVPATSSQFRVLLQEQARAFGHLDRWDHALAAYDKALEQVPAGGTLFVALLQDQAKVLGTAGDWDKAAAVYQRACQTSQLNGFQLALLYQECGHALRNAGHWPEALVTYEKAVQLVPANSVRSLLEDQARAYNALGREKDALDAYEKALARYPERDPQRILLLQDLVRIPGAGGRWDKVTELLKNAVDSQPENPLLHRLLAQAYAEQGQWPLTRTTLEKAPQDPLVQYYLARVLLHTDGGEEYRKVRGDLVARYGQTSVATEPNNIAWILALTPDPTADVPKALELAKKAVSINRTSHSYLNTLGVAYYRAGNYEIAIKTLLEAGDRYVEAQRAKLRPVDKDGRADDLFPLAMAYARLKDRDKAKDALDRAVKWMDARTNLNDPDSTIWTREDCKLLRAEAEGEVKKLIGP
jgi:WD40 repeat protein/tetratricopeptide (TPR) repeat protein